MIRYSVAVVQYSFSVSEHVFSLPWLAAYDQQRNKKKTAELASLYTPTILMHPVSEAML